MSDDLERARAQRPAITCAYCGGHDFVLIIALNEGTGLRCVKHDEHVAQLDLREKRRQLMVDHGLNPDLA